MSERDSLRAARPGWAKRELDRMPELPVHLRPIGRQNRGQWRVEYVDGNGVWRLWLECRSYESAQSQRGKCQRTLESNGFPNVGVRIAEADRG